MSEKAKYLEWAKANNPEEDGKLFHESIDVYVKHMGSGSWEGITTRSYSLSWGSQGSVAPEGAECQTYVRADIHDAVVRERDELREKLADTRASLNAVIEIRNPELNPSGVDVLLAKLRAKLCELEAESRDKQLESLERDR